MSISFFPHDHPQFTKPLGMVVIMFSSVPIALSHSTQNSNTNITTTHVITESSYKFVILFFLFVILLLGCIVQPLFLEVTLSVLYATNWIYS